MKKIIVYYDFTKQSDYAMQYATLIGEAMEASVIMLNIIEDEQEKNSAISKLAKEQEKYEYKYELTSEVFVGDPNSTVRKYAEMNKAMLVILGKKERTGMQKIFGGQTIKMIMGASVPFIVVQSPPKYGKLRKIMFPISFDSMNKTKLRWVQIFSQYFRLDVELFLQNTPNEYDQEDAYANALFAKRYLDRYCIRRKETLAPKETPFKEAVVAHAVETEADLILIMTSGSASFIDYMIGVDEEYVIEQNNTIPVMCVNPNLNIMRFRDFY